MAVRLNSFIFLVVFSVCVSTVGCDDPRDSSSNTGIDRSSLPSPSANATAVPENSNVSDANYSNTLTQEENFWTIAADSGMAAVEMGKIAREKAQDPELKKFAAMMIADHTKANNDLKTVAVKQKITLPTEIGPRLRSTIDELNRRTGSAFDQEYLQAMVDAHEADVQLFEGQAEDASDPQAQAFAAKTLPVLRKHLEAIRAIQSRMQ